MITESKMAARRPFLPTCLRATLAFAFFAVGCGSHQSEKPGRSVDGSSKQAVAEPKAEAPDPEKEEFIKLVQQNADDPDRLEIVLWGEKKNDKREVRFRCARVGMTKPSVTYRLGTAPPPRSPGNPVMLENADIRYKDGKIKEVYLDKTYQVWEPR
jgi:hypothetical protein